MDLVKYDNYDSKNIIDTSADSNYLVNSEHPFVCFLIEYKLLIKENEELRLRTKLFFRSFGSIRYRYPLDEIRVSQRTILDWFEKNQNMDFVKLQKYTITEKDLPDGSTFITR